MEIHSSSHPVIALNDLTKAYGKTLALNGLDLRVGSGEVHGLLGPNGAGKSTAIRILLGLARRDGGRASIWGRDPWDDSVTLHRRMAYVPGDVALWPNLTGGEAIDVLSRMRGGTDAGRRRELIERFNLDPTKRGSTYSTGNRQKVAIIAALASDVDLLVMDEPTAGLDPLMEAEFAECIEAERGRGRTILLSSHTLSQVERLCDQISIIREGRTVESGSLSQMRHLTRNTVRVRTGQALNLEGAVGVHDITARENNELELSVDTEHLDALIDVLHRSEVISLTIQPATLEELFLRHYARLESA